jgi:hypothetical protein
MAPGSAAAWAALLALLLLPCAAGHPQLSVDASRVDLHGSSGSTVALAGAVFAKEGCGGLAVTGTAAHVHLEVDRAHIDAVVAGTVPSETKHDPSLLLDADDATFTLSATQADCRILAWADPGMAATLTVPVGALSLQAAPSIPTSHAARASAVRPDTQIGGPDLLASVGSSGVARMDGSLRLAVWGATLGIEAGSRSFHGTLGYNATPIWPGVDGVDRVNETEGYLLLTGARLAWTLPPQATLLASAATLDAPDGRVDLHDATLVAGDGARVSSPLVSLDAPHGALHVSGSRLRGALDADTPLAEAGQPLSPATTLAAPGASAKALWPALAGLTVLALGARRLALHRMRRALDAGQHAKAARLARLHWPSNAESRVVRTVCLLRLGDLDAAGRALRGRRWRTQRATWSFLTARLEASRGNATAARHHLADCLLLAPAFVADARADQALRGIVEAALGRVQDRRSAREGYA